jgi:copper resistance protein C
MRYLSAFMIFAVMTFGAQPVWARTHLKTSEPKDGSTVQAPKQLTLTFEDEVRLTAVSVAGKDGKATALSQLPKEAVKSATVALPTLASGEYTVNWRATGHDGHVMSGHLKFTVAAPAAK